MSNDGRGAAWGAAPFAGWRRVRDRLLTSARFRRWATAFPLTRPVARRRAKALFDLCAGFVYAQVLLACVRLRVFEILSRGPQTVGALSVRFALSPDATRLLLDAAVSLDLLERRGGETYGLGRLGTAMVDNPGVAAMVEHHTLLYADLADPVALLRGERRDAGLQRYWAYADTDDPGTVRGEQVSAYSALMSASQPMIADEVLAACALKKHRCLLDIGGGDGTFLSAVAGHAPHLRMILFDLPPVAEAARQRFAASGLGARARAVGGNFLSDPLPQGADVVSVVRVIHDHDDASALTILRAAHQALPPGGTLILAEPMAGTSGAKSVGDAYFGFYLRAMGGGRPRDPTTLAEMVRVAGFVRPRIIATRTPMLTRVLVAVA